MDGNNVDLNVTSNPNLAPPGWYMLFGVDANGVPSVAKWVHLQGPAALSADTPSTFSVSDGTTAAPHVHTFAET